MAYVNLVEKPARFVKTIMNIRQKHGAKSPTTINGGCSSLYDPGNKFQDEKFASTVRSMNDLDHEEPAKSPITPCVKTNFFRFPHGTSIVSGDPKLLDTHGNKSDKCSVTEEIKNDIQPTVTKESKISHESLPQKSNILQKTSSDLNQNSGPNTQEFQINEEIPVSDLKSNNSANYDSESEAAAPDPPKGTLTKDVTQDTLTEVNPLPLPPRDRTIVHSINRKRHTRKHALIIQDSNLQRTLNRVLPETISGHSEKTELDKNYQNSPQARDIGFTTNNGMKKPIVNDGQSSRINKNTFQNSDRSQYQNIAPKFSFPSDSFDTPSLKFEAQLENNFSSIDVCDGITSHENDIAGSQTQTIDNAPVATIISPPNAVDQHANGVQDMKNNPYIKKDNLLNLITNNIEMEYIDDTLNNYVPPSDILCNNVGNPLGVQKSPTKIQTESAQPTELSRNVLFNKRKTDLQYLDTLSSSNQQDAVIEKPSNIAVPLVSKMKAADDLALPSGVKQSDSNRSLQRRSVGDNIDELEPCTLAKGSPDRVSVEDLLEFAHHKPCGRQRGTESDEVRIMCKVLNHQVSPETCLLSLEFAQWNVHRAIKLVRLQGMGLGGPSLYECSAALDACGWDVAKAAALLVEHGDSQV